MIDRIRDLILEAAGQKADGAGVPMDRVHIHAAAAEVGALVLQARERLMAAAGEFGRAVPLEYGALIDYQNFQGAPAAAAQNEPASPIEPEPAAPDEPAATAAPPTADPVPEAQPE